MAAPYNSSELNPGWNNGSVSPVEQDEEYEGEGDMHFREFDPSQMESKYWRIQLVGGASKPKWRNCHAAVMQDDTKMIVRNFCSVSSSLCQNCCFFWRIPL